MPDRPKVSAIVPVYNEEKTIQHVLDVLLICPLVDEVVVVNDGSEDASHSILDGMTEQIAYIRFPENRGKGAALAAGIREAKGEIVLFCDADLYTLTVKHITRLLDPILYGHYDGVTGYPFGTFGNLLLDLTGERAYWRKDLLPHLHRIEQTRFGVEVYLNRLYQDKRVLTMPLPGLKGLLKHEKQTTNTALKTYIAAIKEISVELSRQFRLSIQDRTQLDRLAEAADWQELKNRISRISSSQLRDLLMTDVWQYFKSFTTQKRRSAVVIPSENKTYSIKNKGKRTR